MKNPILIIGGGLGGLTAALALARHGQLVRVLEGAPSFGAIAYARRSLTHTNSPGRRHRRSGFLSRYASA